MVPCLLCLTTGTMTQVFVMIQVYYFYYIELHWYYLPFHTWRCLYTLGGGRHPWVLFIIILVPFKETFFQYLTEILRSKLDTSGYSILASLILFTINLKFSIKLGPEKKSIYSSASSIGNLQTSIILHKHWRNVVHATSFHMIDSPMHTRVCSGLVLLPSACWS